MNIWLSIYLGINNNVNAIKTTGDSNMSEKIIPKTVKHDWVKFMMLKVRSFNEVIAKNQRDMGNKFRYRLDMAERYGISDVGKNEMLDGFWAEHKEFNYQYVLLERYYNAFEKAIEEVNKDIMENGIEDWELAP